MSQKIPYQPFLFRVLHSLNGIIAVGALLTGFLVYDSYDRRFGYLGLTTENRSLIDIHGTFGFFLFFIILPLFLAYSVMKGKKRLITKPSQIQTLTKQVNQPSWWYNLHRLVNTLTLTAVCLAAISGKFQDENWLPNQELNHLAYYVHLSAWLLLLICVLIHALMAVKVGGLPLIISMYNLKYKPEDSPRLWWDNIKKIWTNFRP